MCHLWYSCNLLGFATQGSDTAAAIQQDTRRGMGWRVLGCGCVEMSTLSKMTTSVSKITEQSQTPFSLWHHCWGCQQGWQFEPAPEAFFVLMTRVALELHQDNCCISHRPPGSPSCCPFSDMCGLGCAWPNSVQVKKALDSVIVFRAVTSQLSTRLISTHVNNSMHSHCDLFPFFSDSVLLNALASCFEEFQWLMKTSKNVKP